MNSMLQIRDRYSFGHMKQTLDMGALTKHKVGHSTVHTSYSMFDEWHFPNVLEFMCLHICFHYLDRNFTSTSESNLHNWKDLVAPPSSSQFFILLSTLPHFLIFPSCCCLSFPSPSFYGYKFFLTSTLECYSFTRDIFGP